MHHRALTPLIREDGFSAHLHDSGRVRRYVDGVCQRMPGTEVHVFSIANVFTA